MKNSNHTTTRCERCGTRIKLDWLSKADLPKAHVDALGRWSCEACMEITKREGK